MTKFSPKNPWGHLLDILEYPHENHEELRVGLERFKYHPLIDSETFSVFSKHLAADRLIESGSGKINLPSDFFRSSNAIARLPFRRQNAGNKPPSPYPFDLELPPLVASRNDYWPFFRALSKVPKNSELKLLWLISIDGAELSETLLSGLRNQRTDTQFDMVFFGPQISEVTRQRLTSIFPDATFCEFGILSPEGLELIEKWITWYDGFAFLDGQVDMDPGLVDRACRILQISDKVLQGLWPLDQNKNHPTPYMSRSADAFSQRYPFRQLRGLNFVVSTSLYRQVGPLQARLNNLGLAAKEFGWRCFNKGAWFAPLLVNSVQPSGAQASRADTDLFMGLAPNSWDRKSDGPFEIPKVSIYIPAYNCEKYIERAIDSVLNQDVQDLEVCIAVDGSPDGTFDLLQSKYGSNPRVRISDGPNGGIGYASNRAVEMSRGLYVGQLDSDDCLKPGAVRALVEYLDEHPECVCCYSSCERVDENGKFIQPEYSWKDFSREKMISTSIVHHFRMFRRSAWERTSKFRTDIVNAVDYDIYLKLMDTGEFHHVSESYYQRRWHGENTSNVNEEHQTTNTYRVQRESLSRMDLDRFWDVSVPDKKEPRRVTYRRFKNCPRVVFWPDFSRSNPYQHLLYGEMAAEFEMTAGDIASALELVQRSKDKSPVFFHLHWTSFLFSGVSDQTIARTKVAAFIEGVREFKKLGGKFVWTVHNISNHECPFPNLEQELTSQIIELADVLHFHARASVEEMRQKFPFPDSKVRIAQHGSYLGVYDDHVNPVTAREVLGLRPSDDVILHTGQIRQYKGTSELVTAFRALMKQRDNLRLVLAGSIKFDFWDELECPLEPDEADKIVTVDRFIDETEFQLFFRAADVSVFPYRSILTSGSLMLSLSFGVPAVLPAVGMTKELLGDGRAGVTYDPKQPKALEHAISDVLDRKDDAKLAAQSLAQSKGWVGMKRIFDELTRVT